MKRLFCILSVPFFAVTSTALLTGCAAKIVASNDRTAIIDAHPRDAAGAFTLGQQECQKRGMQARLNSRPQMDRQWVFDCIN
jgi:hypothetical protein